MWPFHDTETRCEYATRLLIKTTTGCKSTASCIGSFEELVGLHHSTPFHVSSSPTCQSHHRPCARDCCNGRQVPTTNTHLKSSAIHRSPFVCSAERLWDTALATSDTTKLNSPAPAPASACLWKTSGWCARSVRAALTAPKCPGQSSPPYCVRRACRFCRSGAAKAIGSRSLGLCPETKANQRRILRVFTILS